MGIKFVIAVGVVVALATALAVSWDGDADAFSNEPSFYVRTIHRGDRSSERMRPTIISPIASEAKHPNCPPTLNMRCSDGHGDLLAPYWRSVGSMTSADASEVFEPLAREWRILGKRILDDDVGRPVRVLIKHYPRTKVPGRCVTIHVTFYSVPDPRFDEGAPASDGRVEGVLFDVRQTWQLQGAEPVLIEASVEVTTDVRAAGHRRGFASIAKPDGAPEWGADPAMGAHFYGYGAGRRYGTVWFDRAAGIGETDAWAKVYRLGDGADVAIADLTPAQADALRRFVERF